MSGQSHPRPGPSRRRLIAGGLLIAALAVVAAGCGSSGPSTTTSTSGSLRTGPGNAVQTAFKYARCMRSHGVSNFPDPKVSSSPGRQAIAFHVDPSETGSPNFKSASQACKSILPAPTGTSQAEQQAHKQGLLDFASCMRAHGIAGFPDPDLQGQLTLEMVRAAGIDLRSQGVLVAGKACAGASHGAISVADVEAAVNGAH